ncbi:hypothetical protein [Streptomyces sp. NPDC047000]|uniref:hypothetical protein n=1 Tax=Streptomyces sp. NPDC047000 TaxID=3155474 RepID=UPI0033F21CD8
MSEMTIEHESVAEPVGAATTDEQLIAMLVDRARSEGLQLTGEGRKRWTIRWKAPLNAFQITFEGRLTPANN